MSIVYLGKATPASGQGGGGSITVDQTYDATSTNAQSGTAVAEAVATKQDVIDANNKLSANCVSGLATADNSTIIENASNQLQTVGIVNQNTAVGAVSPLKVWNGTEQEWNTGGQVTWYLWTTMGLEEPGIVYTRDYPPTTASTVYTAPGVASALTITSVGNNNIDLSNGGTYDYDSTTTTTTSIGEAHPDWLCNIYGVGVKSGTTDVANLASYTAGTNIAINNGVISATDTTYSAFGGATSSVAGSTGLVPAPATGDRTKYLKGDGTWATVSSGVQNNASGTFAFAIGMGATASGSNAYSYGHSANAEGDQSLSLGYYARAKGTKSYQIGQGVNNTSNSLQVESYPMLDLTTGKIPNDRINGVSGSFTSQDGKTITVTNGVITSIASISSNVNLTFTVTDEMEVDSLIVNGTTYTSKDFNNDAITLQFLSGTSITWSITTYSVYASPSNGSLTLTSDTTVQIDFTK